MSSTPRWLSLHVVCLLIVAVTSQSAPFISNERYGNHSGPYQVSRQPIPAGYIYYSNITAAFKVHHEKLGWSQAKKTCISEGGRLAVIDTWEKLRYVNASKSPKSVPWVGIVKIRDRWVAVHDNSSRSHLPWARNEPDGNGDCVAVKSSGSGLIQRFCIWSSNFVCEIIPRYLSFDPSPIFYPLSYPAYIKYPKQNYNPGNYTQGNYTQGNYHIHGNYSYGNFSYGNYSNSWLG